MIKCGLLHTGNTPSVKLLSGHLMTCNRIFVALKSETKQVVELTHFIGYKL